MAGSSCEHKVPLKEKICCRVLTIELVNLLLEIGLNLRVRLIMPKNSVAFRNNKKKKKKNTYFFTHHNYFIQPYNYLAMYIFHEK